MDKGRMITLTKRRYIILLFSILSFNSIFPQFNQDEQILCCTNKKLSIKERVQCYVNVSNNIEEDEILEYALGGLDLLRIADSSSYNLKEFYSHKAELLFNIGFYYKYKGNYKTAITTYYDALKYCDKCGNEGLGGDIHNSIGLLHFSQNEYKNALQELLLSLSVYNKTEPDKSKSGRVLINITGVYESEKNFKKAAETYHRAISIFKEIGDTTSLAFVYNNIASLYRGSSTIDSAAFYLSKSLPLFLSLGNEDNIAWTYDIFGTIYTNGHKTDSAIKYCRKCIEIGHRKKLPDQLKSCYFNLYKSYKALGKDRDALIYYVRADSINDSLMNVENRLAIARGKLTYDFNKKEEQLRLESAINDVKHQEENLRTKVVLGFVSVFFIVLGFFAYFIFRNYRKEKLSKETITEQKAVIEEKQKEIIDSIKYAKRIQMSLLASEKYISKSIERLKNNNYEK